MPCVGQGHGHRHAIGPLEVFCPHCCPVEIGDQAHDVQAEPEMRLRRMLIGLSTASRSRGLSHSASAADAVLTSRVRGPGYGRCVLSDEEAERSRLRRRALPEEAEERKYRW